MREEHFGSRKGAVVCYECHKKGDKLVNERNETLKERPLKCSKCQYNFSFDPEGHISAKMREQHFGNRKGPVVCYECHKKGDKVVHESNQAFKERP